MSKDARFRCTGLSAVLIFVVILPTATGQAQHTPQSAAQGTLARAADTIVQKGRNAKLPPHISTLLGLSKEEECQVTQGVVRTGSLVQGFDVSVTNKNAIVIFVADEAANNQDFYLTSLEGTLRKVVSVKAGVGDVARITAKEIEAFKKEKLFWIDRLAAADAAK